LRPQDQSYISPDTVDVLKKPSKEMNDRQPKKVLFSFQRDGPTPGKKTVGAKVLPHLPGNFAPTEKTPLQSG
jgi:hypothetical protein